MFPLRAIQYDVSRGRIPTVATVRERLRRLQPWQPTTLVLYLESVVETAVFPAVGCGATPITREWLAAVNACCREFAVDLAPMVQVLGHQEKLLALPAYEALGELPPPANRHGGNNFNPVSADAREAVLAWLDELIPQFSAPVVHLGCDEAYRLGQGRSAAAVADRGVARVVADWLRPLFELVRRHGRQPAIAADLPIHHPDLAGLLPRDVILTNWGYGTWDEVYERENHHFAAHPRLAASGLPLWLCGNNMAEYITIPAQRLEANVATWLDLRAAHGAEGFLVTDWGTYHNVNPYISSILGDMTVLERLRPPDGGGRSLGALAAELLLTEPGEDFAAGWEWLCTAQRNAAYFPPRFRDWLPEFGAMLLDDPAGGGSLARRFGALEKPALDALLHDARVAEARLAAVPPQRVREPTYLDDLRHLANRVVAIALRLQLWYEYAWNTGYVYPQPARDATLVARLREYRIRTDKDLAWTDARWRADNLESDRAGAVAALRKAQSDLEALFPDLGAAGHEPAPCQSEKGTV